MSMKIEDKLFLDRFKVDEESHLKIIDGEVCKKNARPRPAFIFARLMFTGRKATVSPSTMKVAWNAVPAASAVPI